MFCTECGAELEEGALFCSNCGKRIDWTALENQVSDKVPEKVLPEKNVSHRKRTGKVNYKKEFRKIIATLIFFVVLIFVVKFFAVLSSGTEDAVISVYDGKKYQSTIYLNEKMLGKVEGAAKIFTNMEKSAFYILDGERTVYYVKGGSLKKVMEDCEDIRIARHDRVALLIDKKKTLSRYNGSKLEKIAEDVVNVAVSGDGSTYTYSVYNEVYDIVTYSGRDPEKITRKEEAEIFAISENGRYMYGRDARDNLVCIDEKGETSLISDNVGRLEGFNEDGTEILFTQDGDTYISVKGKEKKKVTEGQISNIYGKESGKLKLSMDGLFLPVDTLKKTVVFVKSDDDDCGDICLLDKRYEAEKIVSGVTVVYGVDKNASGVYYKKNGSLCYVKVRKDAKEKELTDDFGNGLFMSEDYKHVYFINKKRNLCYIKNQGRAKVVDDDLKIDTFSLARVVDNVLYIGFDSGLDFDQLYCVKGTQMKKISEIEDICLSAGKAYAYDKKNLYLMKGEKLKKMEGDFEYISSISNCLVSYYASEKFSHANLSCY